MLPSLLQCCYDLSTEFLVLLNAQRKCSHYHQQERVDNLRVID